MRAKRHLINISSMSSLYDPLIKCGTRSQDWGSRPSPSTCTSKLRSALCSRASEDLTGPGMSGRNGFLRGGDREVTNIILLLLMTNLEI